MGTDRQGTKESFYFCNKSNQIAFLKEDEHSIIIELPDNVKFAWFFSMKGRALELLARLDYTRIGDV